VRVDVVVSVEKDVLGLEACALPRAGREREREERVRRVDGRMMCWMWLSACVRNVRIWSACLSRRSTLVWLLGREKCGGLFCFACRVTMQASCMCRQSEDWARKSFGKDCEKRTVKRA